MCPSGATCLPADFISVSEHYKNPPQRVGLEQNGPHGHIEMNLFSPWYSWKIAELALNNNHLLK